MKDEGLIEILQNDEWTDKQTNIIVGWSIDNQNWFDMKQFSEMFDHSVCETTDPSLTVYLLVYLTFWWLDVSPELDPLKIKILNSPKYFKCYNIYE